MAEQSGLRFDIYERVHLAEDAVGIKDLEEIELTPDVEVVKRNEQAVLRGNLSLKGSYMGDSSETKNVALYHTIPVEITLPLNRISNLENVGIEIEHFDVDVISSRSLNVVGVLSLHGIELVEEREQKAAWREDDTELIFVHSTDPNAGMAKQEAELLEEAEEASLNVPADNSPTQQQLWQTDSWKQQQPSFAQPAWAPQAAETDDEQEEVDQEESGFREETEKMVIASKADAPQTQQVQEQVQEQVLEESFAENMNEEPDVPFEQIEAVEQNDKPDMKIALGSKKSEGTANVENQVDLLSLIHKKPHLSEARSDEENQPPEVTQPAYIGTADSDALEWKNLFMRRDSEEESFKKLKICIVQKEETIDTIAERYNLNPREIALFNRLNETDVTEGQVIYIPI